MKSSFKVLLPLLLLLTLPAVVKAQLNYSINNGEITITGYYGPGGPLAIPEVIDVGGTNLPVTVIDSQAFYLNDTLTSVAIPDSITNIEAWAFQLCGVLTNVTMGKGVISIGDEAFAQCESLTAITVDPANSVYCSVNGVLFNKNKTILIQYPIGNGATTYNIPNGVVSIEDDAFSAPTGLTNITKPNSVTSIGDNAFNTLSLTSITLSTNLTSIGSGAFGWAPLTSVTLPDSVSSIGDNAFGYSGVTSITIGPGVTNMGIYVFGSCPRLTNVVISSSVTNIGSGSFINCSNLSSITIPSDVTSISQQAFENCTSLRAVYFKGNAPDLEGEVFLNDTNLIVYYLPGTTGWGNFGTIRGLSTVLWNPHIQTSDSNFGVHYNQFGFNITGTTNIPIVVEASTNLQGASWTSLQSCTITNGSICFGDSTWSNYPARFYRIRSP